MICHLILLNYHVILLLHHLTVQFIRRKVFLFFTVIKTIKILTVIISIVCTICVSTMFFYFRVSQSRVVFYVKYCIILYCLILYLSIILYTELMYVYYVIPHLLFRIPLFLLLLVFRFHKELLN